VPVLNLLSAPGSGKTALLERLGPAMLRRGLRLAVIVGDLATDRDARRLEAAGVEAVPITTGQLCHLEAAMVARALERLAQPLEDLDLLVIENVGNLVCPAAFDLGESLRAVLLSVSEGEDKPLKYPSSFHSADLVLLGKSDLAAVVGFDRAQALANIEAVAPGAAVREVSARSGVGLEVLLEWLLRPQERRNWQRRGWGGAGQRGTASSAGHDKGSRQGTEARYGVNDQGGRREAEGNGARRCVNASGDAAVHRAGQGTEELGGPDRGSVG